VVSPTFVASAPGRCGIIGNPSDIYGGTVVSCSIPARATCRLTLGEGESLPQDRRLWDAAIARFPLGEPAKVEWRTDVPRSAGLSGSTALLAATLACVLHAIRTPADFKTRQGRTAFAELVRDIELNEAKVTCGYQDAYMICHGGLNRMQFVGKHPITSGPFGSVEPLKADLPFLLVTTGVERLSGSVHGPMRDRWLAGETLVVESMTRIQELGELGAEALVKADYAKLGTLMDENHALVAKLGGSGDAIDRLIASCKANGALGAKLAGAGLGGTVIALTESPDDLEKELRALGYNRFMRPQKTTGVEIAAPDRPNQGTVREASTPIKG
jgi:galactokinase/mevalonate kinase-like predicted kinase